MIKELDVVALAVDVPEHPLNRGDLGTIVMVYGHGAGFEIEFVSPDGPTLAMLTLDPEQITLAPSGRP